MILYTAHRPITKAIASKSDKSARQSRHLECMSQFCMDIRYLEATENILAETLSRNEIISVISHDKFDLRTIKEEQEKDDELKKILLRKK